MISDKLQLTEAEIAGYVQNYKTSGNMESWGRVYEIYKKYVYLQCLKILNNGEDAEDLTSDVFIKAADKIDTYESGRPLLPWLYMIAKNLCIDRIRRNQRIQYTRIDDAENVPGNTDAVDEERTEFERASIKKAIDKLKTPQRTCFCLFYMHDKSYNDIMELTGYSYDEVRSHIQNGRRKFKLLLGRKH